MIREILTMPQRQQGCRRSPPWSQCRAQSQTERCESNGLERTHGTRCCIVVLVEGVGQSLQEWDVLARLLSARH